MGTFARLRPPLPEIDLPVFARHWRLELPPGYAACCSGRDLHAAQTASFSLRRCLLGCLGRSQNQSIFNPFRRADWQSALRWWKTEDRPADPGSDAETAGWAQFPIDLADCASSVLVVRRAAVDAGGWTFFFIVAGVGAWGLSRRPCGLLVLAAVLGLSALLLPPAFSVIFSDGLLGVMFCLVLAVVRRPRSWRGPRRPVPAAKCPAR